MNALLLEVLQYLQLNNYRRASFDRLCGIVPSAGTYDQLSSLINYHPKIFRTAIIRGGLPGLALQDDVHIPTLMLDLQRQSDPPSAPLEIKTPEDVSAHLAPMLPTWPEDVPTVDAAPPGVYNAGDTLPATETPAAPTVTPAQIEAEIASEHFRNLGGALKQTGPAANVTLCVFILKNGFVIIGKSACVNAENFNEEIGRKLAREDAIKQLWPFLGFRLADKRLAEQTNGPAYNDAAA